MAATEAIYATGTLDLPCLVLDQGATIRRQVANLGNDWTKIGIAFATRAIGTSSLASSALTEYFETNGAVTRFAFGLKNNNGTLVGQSGCKFIGHLSGFAGYAAYYGSNISVSSNTAILRIRSGENVSLCGINIGSTQADQGLVGPTPFVLRASTGTEETTSFGRIFAMTIEVLNRGTASQKLRFVTGNPAASSTVTKAELESAILGVSQAWTDVDCPAATYNLDDINCVFIQWPFANNRLLVFGPTSGVAGSPYVMRLA